MIQYPVDNKFESALKCALSHPTFEEGLNWLITWEHENAMRRWITTDCRDTCFAYCVRRYFEARPITLTACLLTRTINPSLGGYQPELPKDTVIKNPPQGR